MAYSISVDTTAIVDGQQIDAADVTTPIGNLKTAVQDLGNGVSAPETLRFAQIATPSTPAASSNQIYFKSDGYPYTQNNTPVERMVGGVQLHTARVAAGGSAVSITTPTISSSFKHLLFVVEARTDLAGAGDSLLMRFNGDTTANYDYQFMNSSATTVTAAESLAAAYILLPFAAIGASGSAGNGIASVFIYNYTSTTLVRGCHIECGSRTGTTTGLLKDARGKGWWRNTAAAISTITIYPLSGTNLVANTAYTLYGFN